MGTALSEPTKFQRKVMESVIYFTEQDLEMLFCAEDILIVSGMMRRKKKAIGLALSQLAVKGYLIRKPIRNSASVRFYEYSGKELP